jgi:hypothetical protein
MISALPKQKNMVMVKNEARTQRFQGVLWFGTERNPIITVLEGQPGDKPINVQGYDLLLHEGKYAAYGDKRLLRYEIDTINGSNKLFFWGLFPMGAEGSLVRWLVKKTGDMVSNEGIIRMARYVRRNPTALVGWCNVEDDLFRPENKGYELYGPPTEEATKAIIRAANR